MKPFSINGGFGVLLVLVLGGSLLGACATTSWQHGAMDTAPFKTRSQTQDEGDLRITAAVPSKAETEAIFGLPLYDRGIQPVWLEIENRAGFAVRYAPTGTDRDYFSPLEVSYVHRGDFSREARNEMDQFFYQNAMPRMIPAGETRSGFVFTHARPGTKGFNVDVFGPDKDQNYSFVFFIDVPGFTPDHANVDFDTLYSKDELRLLDTEGLRRQLTDFPCCGTDASGAANGDPVNTVFIGEGEDLLYALLRANWKETTVDEKMADKPQTGIQHLFGRPADAVFYQERAAERDELRLWLSPMRLDGIPDCMGQVSHYIRNKAGGSRMDPDIDDVTAYMVQNLWYSQSLRQFAWSAGPINVPIDDMQENHKGEPYFTTGYRAVLWVSGHPVSMLDITLREWDVPAL